MKVAKVRESLLGPQGVTLVLNTQERKKANGKGVRDDV